MKMPMPMLKPIFRFFCECCRLCGAAFRLPAAAFWGVLALTAALFMLTGCDSPSAPDDAPAISSITWTPAAAIDGRDNTYTLTVSNADGIEQVQVRGLNDPAYSQTFTGIGADTFTTEITRTYSLANTHPRIIVYQVMVTSAGGHESGRNFNVRVAPQQNVSLQVTVLSERAWPMPGDELRYRIQAQGNGDALTELSMDFGDGTLATFPLSGHELDKTLTHTYTDSGLYDWQVQVHNDIGQSSTQTGQTSIRRTFTIDLPTTALTLTYNTEGVGQLGAITEPDNTASLRFISRDGEVDQTFYAQNGRITGQIPEGEFRARFNSEYSQLNRMMVHRGIHADETQYLSHVHNGEKSWLVRGYSSTREHLVDSNVDWFLDISADVDTRIETLKGVYIDQGWVSPPRLLDVYAFSVFANAQNFRAEEALIVPLIKTLGGIEETQYVVHNWGNPTMDCTGWIIGEMPRPEQCVDQKRIERGWDPISSLPDGGANPPGVIPPDLEYTKNSFNQYMNRLKGIWNSAIVGGNPYNIEIVGGFSPDLTQYLNGWLVQRSGGTVDLFSPKRNVFFISHNIGAGTEFFDAARVSAGGQFYIPLSSYMIVPGMNVVGFDNESTFWGQPREGRNQNQEPICAYSIRDSTIDTSCDPFPEGFTEYDGVITAIATMFGTYSQSQKTDWDRLMIGNANMDGFNVLLPRQGYQFSEAHPGR
ncbi:hypothetical protein CYPRO_1579 [Cyclonatronum proteinivorum]|uniref:PKD domain-containing protein n=2 Tax=Cyclonatronum proteinivorum TaxID=1457365 RepID=A0A345UK28_9BACT|nr:hypothetical protein CYPRO_1579 [Cyclonatronum proteinivorum]